MNLFGPRSKENGLTSPVIRGHHPCAIILLLELVFQRSALLNSAFVVVTSCDLLRLYSIHIAEGYFITLYAVFDGYRH